MLKMKDKTIILAKVETNETKELFVPFGVMYLSDALEKKGFKTNIWHGREEESNILLEMVEKTDPLFVGFTTYTMPNLKPTIELSKKIHSYSIPVVLGGIHATILPELCINEYFVNFLVLREGEETIVELTEALYNNKELKKIPGIVFKVNGEIYNNGFSPFVDLDKYEPRWDKINVESYLTKQDWGKRIIPLVTSRGCPFRCGFCYSPVVNKRRWRMHSEEFIIKQVEKLKHYYKIDGISFRDENFFVNKKRAMKIIENINIPFYAPIRADSLDEEFIEWLDKHNCKEIFIGAESGVDRILKLMNKDITKKDVKKAVTHLSKSKIRTRIGFIIGFPEETRLERIETLEFMKELHKLNPNIQLQLNCYTPYPATPLWPKAIENGFLPPKNNEEWAVDRQIVSKYLPWLDIYEYLTMKYCLRLITDQKLYRGCISKSRKGFFKILESILKFRWNRRFFKYPIEMILFLKIRSLIGK